MPLSCKELKQIVDRQGQMTNIRKSQKFTLPCNILTFYISYGKCSKISNAFFYSKKMLVFRSDIHKKLVRIAEQQSDLGLHCV